MENEAAITAYGYGKLENMAIWVGASVASAFFASLERCSCINLSTSDVDDDDDEEAKDRPLMLTTHQMVQETASRSSVDSLPV